MPNSQPDWDEFRRQMPVTGRWAYFDHAAVAPLSGPAQRAVHDWADDLAVNGAVEWSAWRERVEQARLAGGELLHAETDEIALIRNTTEGVNLVADGFPWQDGDNVVLPAGEFPTNSYPWLQLAERGVEIRVIETEQERVDPDRIREACDHRTRIVAVSWVGYATGWRNDLDVLAEIAHACGALLFVDAIQGLGVIPLDVARTPVDFLAADGHKWLLSPEGAGLFYVRREHLERLRPIGIGWNSVRHAGEFSRADFQLKNSAGRYEGGSYNMPGIAALGASLRLFLDYGVEAISRRLLSVTDDICRQLQACGAEIVSCRDEPRKSGIVSFRLAGQEPRLLKRRCRDRGVIVNSRAGCVRVSPHAYTNQADIDRLIGALGESSGPGV